MSADDNKKHVFGSIFLLANKLQALGDQYLGKDGITAKQWFLDAMISQFGDKPPTLSEVAELMGSSRQNVKQLALKLEEKGFLTIGKDERDARALRLKRTDKSRSFWMKRIKQDDEYLDKLFVDLSREELEIMRKGIEKLLKRITELETTGREGTY